MGAKPRVVIIGGGFGGLAAARGLAGAPVELTLIDRTNHHLFQPLLYQVATAALSAPDIAAPIRRVLRRQRNARVVLDEVTAIDLDARAVRCGAATFPYDHLIVAAGATHAYFGHDEWAAHAPGLKTLTDALEIRRRILFAFERAELEASPEARAAWLRFVIVGAGPTGVELAGAIQEIARKTLAQDFRNVDTTKAEVLLLEGGPRVLAAFSPESSARAQAQLERLGVRVRTQALVTGIDDGGVEVGEERIPARTTLWAAGVQASPLGAMLGAPLDRAGRVIVEEDLSIPGHPEISVIGDLAHKPQGEGMVPGVAQGALQMGAHAAANLDRRLKGLATQPFRYRDKGNLATIGRRKAVAEVSGRRFSGAPAWWLWLLVHVLFLVGFRNRVVVLFEWAMAYFTYNRSARILLTVPASSPPLQKVQPASAESADSAPVTR